MRPTRGSSSTSSATASVTLARTGATWSRSTTGTGLGVTARRNAGAERRRRDAGQQVGGEVEEALVEPGDPRAGCVAARRPCAQQRGGGVLEGLALEQPGEQQVALLPERQLLVEVDVVVAGQQPPGLELDERGGDQQELGGDVEVDDLAGARARPGRRRRCVTSETS